MTIYNKETEKALGCTIVRDSQIFIDIFKSPQKIPISCNLIEIQGFGYSNIPISSTISPPGNVWCC